MCAHHTIRVEPLNESNHKNEDGLKNEGHLEMDRGWLNLFLRLSFSIIHIHNKNDTNEENFGLMKAPHTGK